MADFVFPESASIRQIEQEKMPRLTAARPIFQFMPIVETDDYLIVWEQMDNFLGLQQVRGLDGGFPRVIKVGAKRYSLEPGVYGEFVNLDETELTRRRQLGSFGAPADVTDLVMIAQDQLLQRRLDRIEWIAWTLLATGTFSVAGPTGGVLHTDTFSLQTYDATTWATVATATPLADFRAVQLLGPAKGASFGAGATAFLNRTTANNLLANTNAADLGGKRTTGLANVLSIEEVNMVLGKEDLPRIVVYDEGYFTDAGSFTRFLPNGKVVVIGQRPGDARIGEYRMVRNANNPGMAPGPYTEVLQRREPPKVVNVYDGHSGGPVVYFPGSIVIMDVS